MTRLISTGPNRAIDGPGCEPGGAIAGNMLLDNAYSKMTCEGNAFQMDAEWFDLSPETITKAPPNVRGWIQIGQSMTATIGLAAGGPVDVLVKRQEVGPLNADEQAFFPIDQAATLREVCLSAQGTPLLVARTVFTSDILRTHPQIIHLGTRHLGSLLFEGEVPSPVTARQFCHIQPGMPLYDLVRWRHQEKGATYWGRRTLFWLFSAPLLVTEILLPDLVNSPNADKALRGPDLG